MIASFRNKISLVFAVTDEDSEIIKAPNNKVRSWQKEHKEWNDLVFIIFLERYWDLLDTINDLSFKKVDERLFSYLKKESTSTGKLKTHKQLANDLGTSREMISRTLKKLQQESKIQLKDSYIQILN